MNLSLQKSMETTNKKLFHDIKKPILLKWLMKIQLEMSRIEMQSSKKNFILSFNEI